MSKKAETVDTQEEQAPVRRTQSEQLRAYKSGYETYQAPNGNLSMDNGDPVALVLRGSSPEAVMAAAEKLKKLEPGTLTTRYASLNPGQKRMNSGNQIRNLVKRGELDPKAVIKTLKDVSKQLNAA